MVARVLRPEGKGFLFLDSHPVGCAATVDEMISEAAGARTHPGDSAGPRVLIIGCSAGYGLASAVTGPAQA